MKGKVRRLGGVGTSPPCAPLSRQAINGRMDRADGLWKQYRVGTEVIMLELGQYGHITGIDDPSNVTGFSIYRVTGLDGVEHKTPCCLLRRADRY